MVGVYHAPLVILSVVVAIFASYVALDLAARVSASVNSNSARYWLAGGALSMGTGIWSMHFIGMLAFSLPIPTAYNIPVTLLSLLIAVLSSGFALHVVGSAALSTRKLLAAGTLMGMGIAAMHYTGMAAMEVAPPIRYDETLFALSVAIAVAASIAALWIAFRLRTETVLSAFWKKAGSAVVMGAAIAAMHYTGMAAAHFAPDSVCLVDPRNISNGWLAASVGGFTFLLLTTTLLVSVFDARLADHSARLAATLRKANADLEKHTAELTQAQQALRISEQRYRTLWETSNEAILLVTCEGRIEYANPAVLDIFGHAPEQLLGCNVEILQPVPLREAHRAGLARHLATGIKRHNWRAFETRALHKDGHEFDIELAFSRLDLDAKPMFAAFAKDITARKQAEDRVQRLNRVYAVLSGINALIVRSRDRQELLDGACRIAAEHGGFGIVTIGLWSAETSTLVPAAWAGPDSARFMEITSSSGVPLEQLGPFGDALRQGKPMFVNDIGAELQRGIGGARRKAAFSLGYQSAIALPLMVAKKVAGRVSIYAEEKNFFNAEEIRLLVELADDISFALEHITNEERLNYLAYYDALTGLPNRALFHERLSHQLHVAAQQGLKVVLLLGDVKRFRLINESMGHQSGDALLKEIAARLKRAWPDPDNLARITADRFAGILFNIKELYEISALLDKTASTVTAPTFQIEDRELSIAMTAGIAIFPEDGSDGEQLFNNAEAALKQAKAQGETFLFYQPAMNAAVSETLLLESKLRRALEKAQFVLHYQPKINLVSQRISGLEALIRWNDPDSGLVPPDKFIPLLEETGMINEIGLWAMRQSLADHSDWRRRGLQVPRIAVNVSAVQLARRDFVNIVRKTLDKAGAGAHELDLEITESMLMQDVEGNIAKLRALREMGLKIAIDDFGTGYSSLGYLAKLPVNALKIDRSFIVTMTRDSDSMSIISTIISLAHSLNLLVIAEGVDSEEQRKFLQLLRCDEIQGYLISKPVPAEDVAHLLREDGNRA